MNIRSIINNLSCFVLVLILSFIFLTDTVSAETKTFIREYEYQASEMDSKISSRVIAFQEVKRLLLEEIGTYLQSQTEVINLKLTKDHIIVLTGGVVQTVLISENWDGKKYWMKAMIKLDPSSVAREIEILRNEKSRELEITNINKGISDDLQELKRLKSDASKGQLSEKKSQEYDKTVKHLKIKELYENGYNLLENRQYAKSLEIFTKCIEENSQYEDAYFQRGKAYAALGQYEKAIADFSKTISLNSKSVKAYALRGKYYIRFAMRKKAFDDFNKAIELNPNDAESLSLRGSAYAETDNLVQGKEDIEEAILLDPKLWLSYFTLAMINDKMGDPNLTLDNFNKTIQLNPHVKEAYAMRGVTLDESFQNSQAAKNDYNTVIDMKQEGVNSLKANAIAFSKLGRRDESINNVTHYIDIAPRDPDGYYMRGLIYANAKEMQKAKQDFDHAIELDPKSATGYVLRGQIYGLQGNFSMAHSDFEQAISIQPKNARAYLGRGAAHVELKNLDQAMQDFNRAIELAPKYVMAYINRGRLHNMQNNYSLAMSNFDKAISIRPKNAEAYMLRGYAHMNMSNPDHAMADYNRAIELDPKLAYAYINRGRLHGLQNNDKLAIKDFEQAISIQPKNAEAFGNRGIANDRLGNDQEAIKDYAKAIELNPKYAEAYGSRGNSYFIHGNNNLGCRDAQKACALGSCGLLEHAKGQGRCR